MDIRNKSELLVEESQIPTLKQLERTISQKFFVLYRQKLGITPKVVVCSIFQTYLIVVAEKLLSPLELTMQQSGEIKFLEEIRRDVDRSLESALGSLIEEIARVKVVDLVCQVNIDSDRLIAVAILDKPPAVKQKRQVRK
ncbi:MAG: Na-translocating system protein MpsC family protein [Cyanobacteria bacterium P01_G01_bin.19]